MKKGFTLVEIILSIGLVVIVGAVSIFSFNLVKKENKEKTLISMSKDILTAANVYIETEGNVKDKVYESGEAVVIPLNVLVKEGLLDISGTTLQEDDLKDGYIVSALTYNFEDDDCIDITTNASWTMSDEKPLYICTEVSTKEIEDLKKEINNLKENDNKLSSELDKLKAQLLNETISRNQDYAEIEGFDEQYHILRVDSSNRIILYNATQNDTNYTRPKHAFSTKLKSLADSYSTLSWQSSSSGDHDIVYRYRYPHIACVNNILQVPIHTDSNLTRFWTSDGIDEAIYTDILKDDSMNNLFDCYVDEYERIHVVNIDHRETSDYYEFPPIFTLRLKSSVKVIGGTGRVDDPYILKKTS